MSTDMGKTNDNTPQDEPEEKKFTRGPIFDIMSDEEIEDASSKILKMIEEADDTELSTKDENDFLIISQRARRQHLPPPKSVARNYA